MQEHFRKQTNSPVAVLNKAQHLQDLNPEQLEAVRHGDGPLLIFAGAGSGKTRVLTRRIANLILEHRAHPAQILAVTFTNKAAAEMKKRVSALFDGRPLPSWVSTFHSSCVRILREHAKDLGFSANFAIYDTSDSLSALKRVYKKLNIDPKVIDPQQVRSRIDRAKNEYEFSDSIRNDPYIPRSWAEMMAEIFDAYQAELLAANAMDFGDLICNVVTLFKLEPKILRQYQERFQYLLIDEYQDTNKVQYLLVHMLAEQHKNICVVGDDDQSIYAFRGATIQNILNFQKDHPTAKIVTLNRNYRSTKRILAAANAVIAKNKQRQPKQMITANPEGAAILCYRASDEHDEASFVIRNITTLLRDGVRASDIAIFYRTNAQSRSIEEELCKNGFPYEIFGGHRFYERKEIKDLIAYYRLVLNPHDNEAFLRVINTPTRGIGETSVGHLVSYAGKQNLSLWTGLQQALADSATFLSAAQRKKFSAFSELIEALRLDSEKAALFLADERSATLSERANAVADFLKKIADRSEYLKRLKSEDTIEAESRIENIFELLRVAVEYAKGQLDEGLIPTLAGFLDRASLSSDLDQENTSARLSARDRLGGAISLMTLHLAKGLEFDIVFLLGLEEGLLPHIRSLEDRQALEEERRLFYVGMTRARKRLCLTRATSRQTFGRGNWYAGQPSQFLGDLPRNLLEDISGGFADLW